MANIGTCHSPSPQVFTSRVDSPFICLFAWLSICRMRRVASNLQRNELGLNQFIVFSKASEQIHKYSCDNETHNAFNLTGIQIIKRMNCYSVCNLLNTNTMQVKINSFKTSVGLISMLDFINGQFPRTNHNSFLFHFFFYFIFFPNSFLMILSLIFISTCSNVIRYPYKRVGNR